MSYIRVLSAVANAMTNMAAASRQLFAFARDGGIPFTGWFETVLERWQIPLNCKSSYYITRDQRARGMSPPSVCQSVHQDGNNGLRIVRKLSSIVRIARCLSYLT